jgi:hypothetical protein
MLHDKVAGVGENLVDDGMYNTHEGSMRFRRFILFLHSAKRLMKELRSTAEELVLFLAVVYGLFHILLVLTH